MRYFRTSNATRQYQAGEFNFTFEPVENIGGSWIGLLAVDNSSAASQLAAAGIPQIEEISKDDYEAVKKKPPQSNPHLREQLQQPLPQRPQPAAAPAAPANTSPSSEAVGVELKSARLDVPDELKLATDSPKPKKK